MAVNRRDVMAGLAAAGTLAATGARAQAQVTLDVLYCLPSFARFHEPVAAEFMKRRPDIKIQFRAPATDYDEGHQTMLRAAVTNQLPDVFYSGFHLLAELVRTLNKRNQINEIGSFLAAEPEDWRKANYTAALLSLGQVDGKQYGLGFNASTPIIYVNEDLLKKAGGSMDKFPTDWNGLVELGKAIRASSPSVAGIAYDMHTWPDDWLFRAMILQQGAPMLNEQENAVAFAEPALRAMKLGRQFVTDTGMTMLDWEQSKQAFVAGSTAIYFHTPAVNRQLADLIGTKFTLKTARFPVDNKEKGGLPTGGNAVISMAKDPAKQKAVWEFIKFVTGPEAQKIVVEMTGYMPTNARAAGPDYLGPFYDANPNFRTVFTQLDRARPWQGYPGGNSVRIWRTQRDIINGVMRGETTPEAGVERLVKETNALMKS